jgi:putative oxidoreductase
MSTRTGNILCGISLPVRVALGVIFIAAAWYKIADPQAFGLSIASYQILPESIINIMAVTLPWMEIVIGLTLAAGLWTRAGALAVCGMLLMFMVAIGIALSRDLPISCGCFASADAGEEISAATLWRDGIWLAGAVFVFCIDDGRFGLDFLLSRKQRAS